jgi:hypothetical protein
MRQEARQGTCPTPRLFSSSSRVYRASSESLMNDANAGHPKTVTIVNAS